MEEADFTLANGRRLLQTSDFDLALAALNENPNAAVCVNVTFGRMVGTSGLSGREIALLGHEHQLLTSLQDRGVRTDPASLFVDAAIMAGGDLAIATVDLARCLTVIDEEEDVRAEWHVHTVENPQAIRINW